jgi:molecular chaperone DnaK
VLQGERTLAKDNFTLGRFQLTGIPPAPRGVPQIEVTFDIDANGIVHVSAKDLGTGNEQSITIKPQDSRPSEAEIQRMVDEAKKFEEEDRMKREEIELRNTADTAIFTAERALKDAKDMIDAAERQKIEEGIADLKKALEGDDLEAIQKKMDALTEAVYAVTTKMYQQQAQAAQQQAEGTAKKDDTVVDADYEVKEE